MHDHGNQEKIKLIERELKDGLKFEKISKIFGALSDPTRLKVFRLLCKMEECVVNISEIINMSSPAVAHHLKVLKDAGLIRSRRDGKEVYYRASLDNNCKLLSIALEDAMNIETADKNVPLNIKGDIKVVHEYLVENLKERITVEDLSKKFFISPTTLKNDFKKFYGSGIASHVKEHRLIKAKLLLESTDKGVGEIAGEVGYESQSKFCQAFKKRYGILPKELKKGRKM